MDQTMGGHAPRPDLHRARGILQFVKQMPVFAGGEEFTLKRVIHQRMACAQKENDLDGVQPSLGW
jgi:hypothetical protein